MPTPPNWARIWTKSSRSAGRRSRWARRRWERRNPRRCPIHGPAGTPGWSLRAWVWDCCCWWVWWCGLCAEDPSERPYNPGEQTRTGEGGRGTGNTNIQHSCNHLTELRVELLRKWTIREPNREARLFRAAHELNDAGMSTLDHLDNRPSRVPPPPSPLSLV